MVCQRVSLCCISARLWCRNQWESPEAGGGKDQWSLETLWNVGVVFCHVATHPHSHGRTGRNVCRSTTLPVLPSSGRQADKIIFDESGHQIWKGLGLAVMRNSDKVDVSNDKQHNTKDANYEICCQIQIVNGMLLTVASQMVGGLTASGQQKHFPPDVPWISLICFFYFPRWER